ncbi:DUF262 domain-containing protein [Leptotrichia sp. oral taxon 212]|uniref:DUF262 domain-containing protein n=1 Tax=Leptotrichia sp. oral taxon 212 TaxID=712357 RepID=UPI0006A97F5B|nr:DUF262 domain-containing protein [Leptotrichia sp. oral taxon 212]
MSNKFSRNTRKISEIYNDFKNGTLIVDNSYQRKAVWGIKDNIRLIETILLNLIIPEIFLWDANTDPETGKTITHIVDGQQRVKAISEFIAGQYKLEEKYLIEENIKKVYSGKYFEDLDDDVKTNIWAYEMSIVNLDRKFKIEDVKKMFQRLNLTDYILTEQEKRKSLGSAFGKTAEKISNDVFWKDYKIFNVSDIRRMKDIEYCSSILLLIREGIVDQTSNKNSEKLNQMYKDFSREYKDSKIDSEKVYESMTLIRKLAKINDFTKKKIQMYTLFCVTSDFLEQHIVITSEMSNLFELFTECYSLFKNEFELNSTDEKEKIIIDDLKKYKLASSEGVNKYKNRMIRFEILKKILTQEKRISVNHFKNVKHKLEKVIEDRNLESK